MNWSIVAQNAQNAQRNNPVSNNGSMFGTPPGYGMSGGVAPQPVIITQAPPEQRRAARRRTVMWLGLLFLMIVVTGVVAWVFWPRSQTVTTTTGPVGQVHFMNSGRAVSGDYDEVQIDLTNIPNPPEGQTYYAWIESGSAEQFVPHWQLILQNGSVHTGDLTYPGHNDLLQPDTILLITRESSGEDPHVPTTDLSAHLYYAQLTPLSQTTFTINSCSVKDPAYVCLQ